MELGQLRHLASSDPFTGAKTEMPGPPRSWSCPSPLSECGAFFRLESDNHLAQSNEHFRKQTWLGYWVIGLVPRLVPVNDLIVSCTQEGSKFKRVI